MRKENLLGLLLFVISVFSLGNIMAQDEGRDIYGWLRFDESNQDEYGICNFKSDDPENIRVVYPHDQTEVACAGAFADGYYYVYLYKPNGDDTADPLSFNQVNLSTGEFKQIADYRGMSTLFQDMAYDYSTGTMYALGYNNNTYSSMLLTVNLTNGKAEAVGDIGESKFVALACSYEGQLYGMDIDNGSLWNIDKATAKPQEIGYTGERVNDYLQSMEFDHETNTLYWAGDNFWGTLNASTGEANYMGILGDHAQVVGLYIPFKKTNPEAPGAITDLVVTAGTNGELSATLSWTNPSLNFAGNALTSLTGIEIYRNEQLAHRIDNPVIGEAVNWTDTDAPNGTLTYRVSAINEKGESSITAIPVFVGRDVPAAPTRLLLTASDGNQAKVTWTAPIVGMNGGWIDANALAYKITRLPDNVVLETSFNGNEFTDTSITALNNYSYQVQAITQEGAGGTATTNSLLIGPPLSVPYSCNFSTDEEFALWNVEDANNDGFTWKRETTLDAVYYYYNEENETIGGNDWLISSPIHLEKGKLYRLNFKLQSYDVGYPEKVGVYLGEGKTVADQTVLLGDYEIESNTFIGYKVMLPDNLETGDYHLSFHCHSDPYMFILYVTGVLLEEVSEGSISGVVTDGQKVLPGVEVILKDTERKVLSDEEGRYEFKEVKTGDYTLGFNKTGYRYTQKMNVGVAFGETAIVDVALEQLPVYSVSGKILNRKHVPVAEAKIALSGYAKYAAKTDTDGMFAIPDVYQAEKYKLVVERYGLCNDTLTLDLEDKNIVLEDIILEDKPLAPYLLKAELTDEQMKLNWREPMDNRTFRHDNGIHGGRLGTTGSTAKSVYGSVFRTPAKLTGMTWFTENYLQSHPTVNIFIFDLDADGEPTSAILYSKANVPNKDLEWITYEFPEPVNAPNGYMLALSYEGHVGLGLDNGEGPDYPFVEHTNCYAEDYTTGVFTYTEEHDIRRSLMIRGIGILQGEDELPSVTSDKRYSVWRLKSEHTANSEQWELLTAIPVNDFTYTDTNWSVQKQGFYCYAVKTVYDGGAISSPATFTGTLIKDMTTQIVLNIRTNTPINESKGAKVVLTNADNDAEHTYTGMVDAQGKASFTDVWKGIYKIEITLKGYEDCVVEAEDFSTENTYENSGYVMKEYIVNPFELEVIKTGTGNERRFNWNVVNYTFDDFESHLDFAVNSPGNTGWNYVDADGKETYAIDGLKYINATLPMAYMIFNPYETDPNVGFADPNIRPYSGEKFLASFPANPGPNNDFIISPELHFNKDFTFKFYAKSYTDDYGLELMNVGYSTQTDRIEDFVWLNGEKPVALPMGAWKEYKYTVPAEAKYVTINCVSDNIFIFMVDDIFVGVELPEDIDLERMKKDISFEVYLDGNKVATTKQTGHLFSGLGKGMHKAGVKAVFSSVTTPLVELEFEVEETSGIGENRLKGRTIYPNPAKSLVTVSGEFDYVSIYNVSGNEVVRFTSDTPINVGNLPDGVYMVRIVSGNQAEVTKLVIDK